MRPSSTVMGCVILLLRASPDDAPLILTKANALRLQATRVEKDAGRRKSVADEAERLQARGMKLLLPGK